MKKLKSFKKYKRKIELIESNLDEKFINLLSYEHKVYVAKLLYDNKHIICKVGVTSTSVEERFAGQLNIKLLEYKFLRVKDGVIARGIEQALINNIIPRRVRHRIREAKFVGYTECFMIEMYDKIVDYLSTNFIKYKLLEK